MSGNWHKRGNLRGANGVGVPEGGQPGQMLQKVGSSDYATGWAFPEYKDILGKVPKSALPDIGNSTQVVDSESAMLNLPAVAGNMVIRTDLGKTFVLAEEPASVLENWVELVTSSDVQSVNGKTGNVTLTKTDVGLSKVNNTADADKPVATTSVNGLMSKADKAKLDKATSNATASTVVSRDSAGKSKFKGVTIESPPSVNTDATTKAYVDAQVSAVAGGSVLSDTDWNAMRTTASTGVVEGWVKGCPAGGEIVGTMSIGFVRDPVWKLEVRPEGLGYVTQRATLLNCVPKYMIGFVWERIYNPAEAKWSAWTCVAGDTGELRSVDKIIANTTAEEPLVHRNSPNNVILYTASDPITVQRLGNDVTVSGAMRGWGTELTSASSGRSICWFTTSSDALGAGDPGCDFTVSFLTAAPYTMNGVQQASSKNRWWLERDGNSYYARRYGPGDPSTNGTWLPFQVTYPAPRIGTYTGPGWAGGTFPPQSGTGD